MNKELEQKALEIERKSREDSLLMIYDGEDKIVSSLEFKEIVDAKQKSGFKLNTQIPSLNEAFDGFREGNLITISGHSGEGKTQFCQSLTQHFSNNKINSVWFSFEMGEEEFLERFGNDVPVFYLPKELKTDSLKWLSDRFREAILKYQAKVVFLDHLHFMIGMKEDTDAKRMQEGQFNSNYATYIGLIVRAIKTLAIKHKLVVFLVCHPRKSDETQALTLFEIGKDSSSIVQDSDAVLSIWREKSKDKRNGMIIESGKVFLNVLKNRRKGIRKNIPLVFDSGKYLEMEQIHE